MTALTEYLFVVLNKSIVDDVGGYDAFCKCLRRIFDYNALAPLLVWLAIATTKPKTSAQFYLLFLNLWPQSNHGRPPRLHCSEPLLGIEVVQAVIHLPFR